MLVIIFTISMCLSAALLFVVEPMLAKMMLPLLGGTPAVWNTCLVFFQGMLLAGYLYAYASLKWLGRRTQIAVHLLFVLLPLLCIGLLPLHLPPGWEPPAQSNPVLWMLALLSVSVGLPFFVLSSNTPILQRWFADSSHHQARDPYFLYAASNAGSLAGLLSYPLVLEPLLRLSQQSRLWSLGYVLFVAFSVLCAALIWNRRGMPAPAATERSEAPLERGRWKQRLRWIALAFVPSSLMLGVTTELTADVPAIPLFWVLPLALYLISFILVFARKQRVSREWMIRRLPFLILASLIPTVSQTKFPLVLLLLLYLLVLFAVAIVCHGELARNRPEIDRLTEFYLLISVGGVVGGIFNSILAPIVFNSVLEFPLILVFAALLRPPIDVKPLTGRAAAWAMRKDWLLPLALGICMVLIFRGMAHAGIRPTRSLNILIFGYSLLWCMSFGKRPLRFAVGLTAVLIASSFFVGTFGHILDTERSFFGVSRVTNDPENKFRLLFHGGTIHGMQSLDPARSREPLTYYTRIGPAGQIFKDVETRMPHGNLSIVGLGAGAMACHLELDQTLTYYEIDPLVARIAEDPRWFTLLHQCAPGAKIVLGDARIELQSAPDAHYELIVLDAFSGDSIPMHLLTREALALYLRKLAPGGILAFHVSNIYLDLAPTLGNLAQDAHLACLVENDINVPQAEIDQGRFPSIWVVMSRNPADLAYLAAETGYPAKWQPMVFKPGARVWTDDYSNLLRAIRWR
jgi:hypothetical protein